MQHFIDISLRKLGTCSRVVGRIMPTDIIKDNRNLNMQLLFMRNCFSYLQHPAVLVNLITQLD